MATTTPGADLTVGRRHDPLPSQRPASEHLGLGTADAAGAAELRDRLTRQHLRAVGEAPGAGEVIRFRRNWWDGAARVPSVVVRVSGQHGHLRYRLVDAGGRVVSLPVSAWRARRALRRIRRPTSTPPALLLLTDKGAADSRLDVRARVTVVRAQPVDRPRGTPSVPRGWAGHRRVIVEQNADALRCPRAGCAGLVPIPPPGRIVGAGPSCPRCGAG